MVQFSSVADLQRDHISILHMSDSVGALGERKTEGSTVQMNKLSILQIKLSLVLTIKYAADTNKQPFTSEFCSVRHRSSSAPPSMSYKLMFLSQKAWLSPTPNIKRAPPVISLHSI